MSDDVECTAPNCTDPARPELVDTARQYCGFHFEVGYGDSWVRVLDEPGTER